MRIEEHIIFRDASGHTYKLRVPTFFEYLLYLNKDYDRIWKRLYESDLPRPSYWKRIIISLFENIFPSGGLWEDGYVFPSDPSEKEQLVNVVLNLFLVFGIKPHEILSLKPAELSFDLFILAEYNRMMEEEQAREKAMRMRR